MADRRVMLNVAPKVTRDDPLGVRAEMEAQWAEDEATYAGCNTAVGIMLRARENERLRDQWAQNPWDHGIADQMRMKQQQINEYIRACTEAAMLSGGTPMFLPKRAAPIKPTVYTKLLLTRRNK